MARKKKVRVGLLGAGSIAIYRHAPELAAHPCAEVTAIYDPILERAEDLADEYGAKVADSEKAILENKKIDAVVVATPNAHHARLTIAALKAGKHVLCEKPMATSLADADKMIKTAQKTGRKLMIGHNQRLMAPHVKARQLLASGELGRVLTFRTSFGHAGPEMWSQDQGAHTWFFKKGEAFVGSMGDLGVHKADLIRWLLADEVAQVAAFVETLEKTDDKGKLITVDDNAVCILKMCSGAVGQLTASWTYKGDEDNTTIIYCENGVITLGANPSYPVEVQMADGQEALYKVGAIATNEVQVSSGIPDLFIDAILDDKEPEIGGIEGYKALAIVLACLQSAETGQMAKVEC